MYYYDHFLPSVFQDHLFDSYVRKLGPTMHFIGVSTTHLWNVIFESQMFPHQDSPLFPVESLLEKFPVGTLIDIDSFYLDYWPRIQFGWESFFENG